jgi:hypothetical protein
MSGVRLRNKGAAFPFRLLIGAQFVIQDGPAGAFDQDGALRLRVAGVPRSAAWIAEGAHVLFLVGDFKVGSVHGNQSIPCKKGVGIFLRCQWSATALGHGLQSLPLKPRAGFTDG